MKLLAIDPGDTESAYLRFYEGEARPIDRFERKIMPIKTCSNCLKSKDLEQFYKNCGTSDGHGSWCKDCERGRIRQDDTAAYRETPEYREARRRYRESAKGKIAGKVVRNEKAMAREKVNAAKRSGRLVPPSRCERCGVTAAVQAHHSDYDAPLLVDWLCIKCHAQADREARCEHESVLTLAIPGDPVGYYSIGKHPNWTRMKQYHAYKQLVQACAARTGLLLPLTADKDNAKIITTSAFFRTGVHPDPENIHKGVKDALFYGGAGSGDKHTGGSYRPPQYDKNNPRVIVEIRRAIAVTYSETKVEVPV